MILFMPFIFSSNKCQNKANDRMIRTEVLGYTFSYPDSLIVFPHLSNQEIFKIKYQDKLMISASPIPNLVLGDNEIKRILEKAKETSDGLSGYDHIESEMDLKTGKYISNRFYINERIAVRFYEFGYWTNGSKQLELFITGFGGSDEHQNLIDDFVRRIQ